MKTSHIKTSRRSAPRCRPLWASPAGKSRTATYLAELMPAHKVYVEPFAGSAAVLFAKPPVSVEVVSDIDAAIGNAFQNACSLTAEEKQELIACDWVGSKERFNALKSSAPQTKAGKLHRFMYISHFSYLRRRESFSPSAADAIYPIEKRLTAALPRLQGIQAESGDYETVVRKHDSEDTLFFFDPPYAGTHGGVGEEQFDEERFFEVLKSLRGKFLMTYGTRGSLAGLCRQTGFHTELQFWGRDNAQSHGLTGSPQLATYLIANYPLLTARSTLPCEFTKALPIIKVAPDERYLLGVVLEPDVVDAHGDIYGADDIRKAAHGFMEHSQVLGHMHRWKANGRVRILESYLLPADCKYGDVWLRKGTWMLGVRIADDDLWQSVRSGELTGFSIGGSASRTPLAKHEVHR